MANYCAYLLRAVARDKAALTRLEDIMTHRDNEFYLYKIYSVCRDCEETDGTYYALDLIGAVGWSAYSWVHDEPQKNSTAQRGAHYSSFKEVCPALDIGVEIFAEESGCEFQEHFRVNHKGEVTWDECKHWIPYYDEDGYRDESKDEGGIEDYAVWSVMDEIYGEESDR